MDAVKGEWFHHARDSAGACEPNHDVPILQDDEIPGKTANSLEHGRGYDQCLHDGRHVSEAEEVHQWIARRPAQAGLEWLQAVVDEDDAGLRGIMTSAGESLQLADELVR